MNAEYARDLETQFFLSAVLLRVAGLLEITDAEWLSPTEQIESVRTVSPQVARLYEGFKEAYLTWYRRCAEIDAEGKSGNLTDAEKAEFFQLVRRRDQARLDLRRELNLI